MSEGKRDDPAALADGVLAGDRRSLARAITLVESQRADHVEKAQDLLARVMRKRAAPTGSG